MKLLIAYDGGDASAVALHDLTLAGLPDDASATVLAICATTNDDALEIGAYGSHSSVAFMPSEAATLTEMEAALATAREGEAQLRALFPSWDVRAEARAAERPSLGILDEISQEEYDLVVIGSNDRSILGRTTHPSTARAVLSHSTRSVRIGRQGSGAIAGSPLRVVVGVDGSPYSVAAVEAVVARKWPVGTVIRVVGVMGELPSGMVPLTTAALSSAAYDWSEADQRRIRHAVTSAVETSRSHGLMTILDVRESTPAKALLQVAEQWGADTIVLGAQGHGAVERFLLGSVSFSVAMHARCSVEIIRSDVDEAAEGSEQ